jgi:hypothetical protein
VTVRPPASSGSTASSGNVAQASLPVRVSTRHLAPDTESRARMPSHLNSADQPGPSGTSPGVASIGSTRGGKEISVGGRTV